MNIPIGMTKSMQVRKLNKVCLEKKLDTFLCPPLLVFQINYRSLCIGLVNKSKNKTNRTAIKAAKKRKKYVVHQAISIFHRETRHCLPRAILGITTYMYYLLGWLYASKYP